MPDARSPSHSHLLTHTDNRPMYISPTPDDRLTQDIGLVLAELPLDPQLGRMLLASARSLPSHPAASGRPAPDSTGTARASSAGEADGTHEGGTVGGLEEAGFSGRREALGLCSEEVATLAALLSVPHLWVASRGAHRAQVRVLCVVAVGAGGCAE